MSTFLLGKRKRIREIIEEPEWQTSLRNDSGLEARMKNIGDEHGWKLNR